LISLELQVFNFEFSILNDYVPSFFLKNGQQSQIGDKKSLCKPTLIFPQNHSNQSPISNNLSSFLGPFNLFLLIKGVKQQI